MSRRKPLPRDGNQAKCRRQLDILCTTELRGRDHNRWHQGAEQLGHGAVFGGQRKVGAGFRGHASQDC